MPTGRGVKGQRPTPEVLLPALAAFPDELARALEGYSQEELTRPGQDGGWGVVEILAHLRDWEEIFLDRAHAIAEQDHPYLPAYDDELWPIERDYRNQDPSRTLDEFRGLRARLVDLLGALPPAAWARVGNHGRYGEISLLWLANHIAAHDRKHLEQAREVLA